MSAATHSSRPLSVRVSREKECADNSMVEPMSPTGRVMEELGVCIVVVIGLGTPVNLPVFRAGIETELLTRFPRFRSIQVMDESTNNGKPRWVQTPVNMDDHIVVPRLDPEAVASDPEKAVEDYVASLSLLPMDRRRPLWELHFLDFPSSEAAPTTINDVLAGVTSAALSQYYFKKSGDTNMKRICLRSLVLVDARPVSTRQTYVTRVETGNRLSSLICPFNIALQDDPLEYVREAKRFMHRKKSSLEVLFTRVVGEFLVKKFGVKKAGAFIFRRFVERTTIIFSNALGPVEHMALCGHPVVFMAPSIYGPPQALTVHYHNYGSDIKVVLAVDDAQFPDCHQLLDDRDGVGIVDGDYGDGLDEDDLNDAMGLRTTVASNSPDGVMDSIESALLERCRVLCSVLAAKSICKQSSEGDCAGEVSIGGFVDVTIIATSYIVLE
ncbi:O-acyltransferase WSD1 [Triticum urartu]|uniref:O-acyltransferase WSD1 n=1 Tax=Triticum urartu TaxID=4572 RepID=M7ZKH3_TRIUA|nr:O-acyltransferase WSD1 [Triticum urartu]